MEKEAPKLESKIEIINPPQEQEPKKFTSKHFLERSILPVQLQQQEETLGTPFFKSRSRRRRTDTWVISIFVILHLLAFVATMVVNDCRHNSHGFCALPALGRMSFQPPSENPLLGPSASTLDKMGAIRVTLLLERKTWRIFSCSWLHAGVIHLVINLVCIIFFGGYLEKEFGPLRIGIIYVMSAFCGTLLTAIAVRDSPAVSSSGALFGLLGATFSALIRNWKIYTHKVTALLILFCVCACNMILGLLPYIDNYANTGGLLSGFLLGFALLFTPEIKQVAQNRKGLYDYDVKSSVSLNQKLKNSIHWKQMLDSPVLRIVSLVLFFFLFAAFLVLVLLGINISKYCSWCGYFDCLPSKMWSCNDMTTSCEIMSSNTELTLTCMGNGNFRVLPYTNISQARVEDICTLICS